MLLNLEQIIRESSVEIEKSQTEWKLHRVETTSWTSDHMSAIYGNDHKCLHSCSSRQASDGL